MAAVALDTMVISALLHPSRTHSKATEYRALIGSRAVVVSFAVVTELRFGALKAGWGELRKRGLERDLTKFTVVQPDDDLMHRCAELRARSESIAHPLGQKIHEADRWIAATCLYLAVPLVSDDGVFEDVEGLRLERTNI